MKIVERKTNKVRAEAKDWKEAMYIWYEMLINNEIEEYELV